MQRIVLEPSPLELGLRREQYDALVAELETEGYSAEVVRPVEYRGLPEAQTLFDITVRVVEIVGGAEVVAKLVSTIKKHLRGKTQGRTRQGCIYLPSGEKHVFDLPEE